MLWKVFVTIEFDGPSDTDTLAYRVEADTIVDAIADVQARHPHCPITKAIAHDQWKEEHAERRRLKNGAPAEAKYRVVATGREGNALDQKASTYEEISKSFRRFVRSHGYGASDCSGARVYGQGGEPVATVSYNGKLWAFDPTASVGHSSKMLYSPYA